MLRCVIGDTLYKYIRWKGGKKHNATTTGQIVCCTILSSQCNEDKAPNASLLSPVSVDRNYALNMRVGSMPLPLFREP